MLSRGALRLLAATIVLSLTGAPACHGCAGAGDPSAGIPTALRIPVEIDGKEAAPIDAALLQKTPPDFTDGERRAWRLRALIPSLAGRPGVSIDVEDAEGKRTVLGHAAPDADGREPALALNRTGEVRAALVKPDEPFPPFHGRGGNRGRGGDPNRIREVRRIWIAMAEPARAAAPSPGELSLQVVVDGAPAVTWSRAELAKVPPLPTPAGDGEGQRDAWSLRELAKVLVGPDAAVVQVSGEGGKSAAIDAAAWSDVAKLPLLRANRRGLLKFQWFTRELEPLPGDDVRAVSGLEIRRRAAP